MYGMRVLVPFRGMVVINKRLCPNVRSETFSSPFGEWLLSTIMANNYFENLITFSSPFGEWLLSTKLEISYDRGIFRSRPLSGNGCYQPVRSQILGESSGVLVPFRGMVVINQLFCLKYLLHRSFSSPFGEWLLSTQHGKRRNGYDSFSSPFGEWLLSTRNLLVIIAACLFSSPFGEWLLSTRNWLVCLP